MLVVALLVICGLKVSGLPSMHTTRLLLKAGDAADIKIANAPTEITDFIMLNSLGCSIPLVIVAADMQFPNAARQTGPARRLREAVARCRQLIQPHEVRRP